MADTSLVSRTSLPGPRVARLTDGRLLSEGWALPALLMAYPLWWVVGLSEFVWAIFAIPMAALLYMRGNIVVPKGFLFYMLFVGWMLATFTQIDTAGRMVGFALRATYYFSCGTVLLYIINAPPDLTTKRITKIVTYFFMIIVGGGWLGLLLPSLVFKTPMAYLMPGALLQNDFVQAMVTPGTADVQDFLGFPVPRPKAPFTFTNGWGSATALAAPFAFAALADASVGIPRRYVRLALVAAVPPAIFSLNRGLWLCISASLIYAALRFFSRGNARAVVLLAGLAAVVACLWFFSPLGELAQSRIATPHSDEDRSNLYTEAISRTWRDSPFLGHGAPRPSEKGGNHPPIGTHGQLWLVLFSHGYVGVVLYMPMFLMIAWKTRNARGYVGFWAHTVVLVGLLENFFYGQLPQQLTLIMIGCGVALRESQELQPLGPILPLTPASAMSSAPSDSISSRPSGAPVAASPSTRTAAPIVAPDISALGAVDRRASRRKVMTAPARVPEPFAGASPRSGSLQVTDELAWLGQILWQPSAGIRLSTAAPASNETILESWLASPSADAPTLFLPEDRRVLATVLRRYSDATPARQRVKIVGATGGARAGLGTKMLRGRVNVLANEGVVGNESLRGLSPDVSLLSYLQQVVGENDLQAAITIGPRRANRKPVIQLVRPNGQAVAFAKIGWDANTAEMAKNESDWLGFISSQRIKHFNAPRLLHAAVWNGLHVLVVSAVPVYALPSRPLRRLPNLDAIWEIAALGGTVTQPLAESAFVDFHQRSGKARVTALLPHLVNRYGSTVVQIGNWHGDLSPWNISTGMNWRPADGLAMSTDLTVFDWEFAASGVPTGFDVFHYFLQIALILDEMSGQDAIRSAWTEGQHVLQRVGVDAGSEHVVFACYLIELISRCEDLVVDGQPERLVDLSAAAHNQLVELLR